MPWGGGPAAAVGVRSPAAPAATPPVATEQRAERDVVLTREAFEMCLPEDTLML
eukprot:gene38912-30030_t